MKYSCDSMEGTELWGNLETNAFFQILPCLAARYKEEQVSAKGKIVSVLWKAKWGRILRSAETAIVFCSIKSLTKKI